MNEHEFERAAVARLETALREVPFILDVSVDYDVKGMPYEWDALAEVRTEQDQSLLLIECKRRAEPKMVRDLMPRFELARIKHPNWISVLVAPYISPASAEICREHAVSYLDFAGNCHLSFDHVFIRKEGIPNPFHEERSSPSLFSPKAERILRNLLHPDNWGRNWDFRSLASHCEPGVSVGLVHRIIQRLVELDYVSESRKAIRLVRPEPLLLDWAKNYRFERNAARRLYSTLPQRKLEDKIASIIENATLTPNCEGAWASFSAAQHIAPFVRQHRVYFYLKGDIDLFLQGAEFKEVSTGENIVVLTPYDDGVFYQRDGLSTNAVQTYLDVQASGGRGLEAAERILELILRPRWKIS